MLFKFFQWPEAQEDLLTSELLILTTEILALTQITIPMHKYKIVFEYFFLF